MLESAYGLKRCCENASLNHDEHCHDIFILSTFKTVSVAA
ncbi:hypothetical protein EUBDOL_01145 [Amedibacillus dolichus DSM 3991]|uniref:Uncharacterized protein n=1 Tax=Amedibacillus dolichus DSM 3991 TaxID=428127 RepID=A8RBP2_9FIRM|nr:hypothetical protein EUBDOL_01145 [Amedibacillus dolichus DSM 3991]